MRTLYFRSVSHHHRIAWKKTKAFGQLMAMLSLWRPLRHRKTLRKATSVVTIVVYVATMETWSIKVFLLGHRRSPQLYVTTVISIHSKAKIIQSSWKAMHKAKSTRRHVKIRQVVDMTRDVSQSTSELPTNLRSVTWVSRALSVI